MERFKATLSLRGSPYYLVLGSIIWMCNIREVASERTQFQPDSHNPFKFVIADPPMGVFGPIEISPAVLPPHNLYPLEPLSPMYPTFPKTYEPVLTGKCPVNFSAMSNIVDKTASDCSAPLARLVGNVICCPQFSSFLHIFKGSYSNDSNSLVLKGSVADDCFTDIITILASRGANHSIPELCSVKPKNLTGGSCPVKDVVAFEKIVNTSELLDACSTVDPLKECCRPICQPAITEAALRISLFESSEMSSPSVAGLAPSVDSLNDCKEVVHAWLSKELPSGTANNAFRILSSCKVNKACPLEFKDPSAVVKACRNVGSSSPSCCSSLGSYISEIQKQMLITNRQAINCATLFGSMLQKGGVMTDIYELCNVDLKDFSLQAYGQRGCLLRSLPTDMIFDTTTGFSFTCDLSDNIAAPWPSSATISSLSLCAPEMSLPALPMAQSAACFGKRDHQPFALLVLFCILTATL